MRTAYINKQNSVVYIAAFEEDKIKANAKGKLLFGGSEYDAETGVYRHTLGSGEEVFEVDGNGLNVGDIFEPSKEENVSQKDIQDQEEKELDYLLKQAALEFQTEKILQDPDFESYLNQKMGDRAYE